MPDLPIPRAPTGATPAHGFTPNPHHQKQLRIQAGGSDALRVLEIALELAKLGPADKAPKTAADLVADAQVFLAFLSRARSDA
jgi:hypothetical protein